MPKDAISLKAAPYVPTASVAGDEPLSIFRGENALVRSLGGSARIENYPGTEELFKTDNTSESYDLAGATTFGTLTGVTWNPNVDGDIAKRTVAISGGTAKTTLRPGQKFLAGTQCFTVDYVVDDTHVVVESVPDDSQGGGGVTGYYLPVLQNIGRRRFAMRRGGGIEINRKDILIAGDGPLYREGIANWTGTGAVTLTRRPKRLQRASDGTYTEQIFGFPDAPPSPAISVEGSSTGPISVKNMSGAARSFRVSYLNLVTKGFSNPTEAVKTNTAGAALILDTLGGSLFVVDFTIPYNAKPTNATGFIVYGTLSGVTPDSTSNLVTANEGPWYEVCKIEIAPRTIDSWDPATDRVTIANHPFKNGDWVYYNQVGGAITGLSTNWYVVYSATRNTFQVNSSAAFYKAGTVVDITLAAGGPSSNTFSRLDPNKLARIEYADTETGMLASGDNDQPPECEWVTEFANVPQYVSCFGEVTATNPLGGSLGNFVLSAKQSNIEAAPTSWRTSVGDEIVGVAAGTGRMWCLTRNGVPFITPTGRTELARLQPTNLDMPFTVRPFATKGGLSPYNLCVVQNDIYMFTGGQPLRSNVQANEKESPLELGKTIWDIIETWKDGQVFVMNDPFNQHICFIGSAVRRNDDDKWVSEILPLDLSNNQAVWQPLIVFTSTTEDRIISGAAIVNNRLEFLMGGRTAGNPTIKTYRYSVKTTEPVNYYVAYQPSDMGEERKSKYIKSFRMTGRMHEPVFQVHGARHGETISISNIENGYGPGDGGYDTDSYSSGNIGGNTSTLLVPALQRNFKVRRLIKNLQLAVFRISGTWPGTFVTSELDRIDEVVIELGVHGKTN